MIFLTVGTQEPYDRLVRAVDEWAQSRDRGDELFGQITEQADYHPISFASVGFLDPESFQQCFRESDLIVAHAGMGTIITSMRLGKRLVMVPRQKDLGEHRSDHQWATAQRFSDRPGIHAAMSEKELPELLDRLTTTDSIDIGAPFPRFAEQNLISAIRAVVTGR